MLRPLYILGGLALLMGGAHVTISRTVGYGDPAAVLILLLACGVALGSIGIGDALSQGRRGLAMILAVALVAGEAFGFLTTAERYITSREALQAPIHDAEAKHKAAEARLAAAEHSDAVQRAEAAAAKVQADAMAKSAEKGCAANCRQVLEAQVRAATGAVETARQDVQHEVDTARTALAAVPLPASASPLADRLGVPAWGLDLLIAGLASLACNTLAAALIALGAHGRQREVAQKVSVLPRFETVSAVKPSKVIALRPNTDLIGRFMRERVIPARGQEVETRDLYAAFVEWCAPAEPLPPSAFAAWCKREKVAVRREGDDFYLMDVKLAS